METLDAVLFDLDGTLVDSAPELGAAANDLRLARGLDALPLGHYRAMAGAGARGMLGVAFGLGPGDPAFAAMREEFFDAYERRLAGPTPLFPGVAQVLLSIQERGLRWGIVTNKIARFSAPLLAATPALHGAAVVVSGDTTPHAKPHPAPLLHAAAGMGLPPARCAYVGDDARDIAAGRAAGMRTIAAAWGYLGEAGSVDGWQADAVAHTPHEVLKFLRIA